LRESCGAAKQANDRRRWAARRSLEPWADESSSRVKRPPTSSSASMSLAASASAAWRRPTGSSRNCRKASRTPRRRSCPGGWPHRQDGHPGLSPSKAAASPLPGLGRPPL